MPWYYNKVDIIDDGETLADYFRRVLEVTDFVACIFGRKYAGKSWAAMSLAEDIDPRFSRDDVVFKLEDFYKQMQNGGERDFRVMCMDDFGSELNPMDFIYDSGKEICHFFQKSRTLHTGYFISTPNKMFLNKNIRERIADYYIEVLGKNIRTGETRLRVQRIYTNAKTGKTYYYNLYCSDEGVINHDAKGKKIVEHIIYKPTDALIEWYIPIREALAKEQLVHSANQTERGNLKNERIGIMGDRVARDLKKYLKTKPGGKQILNMDLISIDLSIGWRKVNQIKAWLMSEGFLGPDGTITPHPKNI